MNHKIRTIIACFGSLLISANAEFIINGDFELEGYTGNGVAAFTGWTGLETDGKLRYDGSTTASSDLPESPNTMLRLLSEKSAYQTFSASWAGADTLTLSLNACEVSWKSAAVGNGVWVSVKDPVNQTDYYSVLVDLDGTHAGQGTSYASWQANQTFSFEISGADLISQGAVAGQDLNVAITSSANAHSINWVDNVSLTLANLPAPDIWLDGGQGLQLVDERVAVWTNLASPGTYDAVQLDASKRPALMYESFPGHQVLGFDGVDDILTLENTAGDALFEGEVTVFYVGRTQSGGSFSGTGGFLGNFQTGNNFKNGWNLRTQSDGSHHFLLGNGSWNNLSGGTASLGGDFVLLNGRYSDVGDGSGTMELFSSLLDDPATAQTSPFTLNPSSVDISIGMFCGWNSQVFNQAVKCEVAEIRIYGQALSDLEREAIWGELSAKYAVAEEQDITVDSFSPSGDSEPVDTSIEVAFNIAMNPASIDNIIVGIGGLAGLPENGNWVQATGQWVASADNKTFTFTAVPAFEPGDLVMCEIPSGVVSAGGNAYTTSSRKTFSFIIDNGKSYSVTSMNIDPMAIVYHDNGDEHILPMNLYIPTTDEPCPVIFWVHGGGWGSGGDMDKSSSPGVPVMYTYFTEKLGVAVASVAWRSLYGSDGTFTKANIDINEAIEYVIDHADALGIDTSRMGLYGGSAGTPTSALVSQLNANISCYIGFNGLYDFVNRAGGSFGGGTSFSQHDPSYTANSAALNVRATNPPDTLLLHGSADTTIEHEQSEWYEAAIEAEGGTASTLIYQDEVHAFFNPGRDMYLPTMHACSQHLTRVFNLSDENATPYDQWAASIFSGAPEGADITATGNPDGDRFDNELEWALVINPLEADEPTKEVSVSSDNLIVTYYRRDSAVTGIDVYASWASLLSAETWKLDGDGMTESSMGWNDDVEMISVTLPVDGTAGFIRVNAEAQ